MQRRLYLAYGSNLWLAQMAHRCPGSRYEGIGVLTGWRWIINSRGYANVVPSSPKEVVYGMVYSLTGADETALDGYEGVPDAYVKQELNVDFSPKASGHMDGEGGEAEGKGTSREQRRYETQGLVYVDVERLQPCRPRREYVTRMNHGINDALDAGVPQWYVDGCLRGFIPPQSEMKNTRIASSAEP